jgi:hypothetical protein
MKIRNKSEFKNFFHVLVSWCLISFVKQAGSKVVVGNFAHYNLIFLLHVHTVCTVQPLYIRGNGGGAQC